MDEPLEAQARAFAFHSEEIGTWYPWRPWRHGGSRFFPRLSVEGGGPTITHSGPHTKNRVPCLCFPPPNPDKLLWAVYSTNRVHLMDSITQWTR